MGAAALHRHSAKGFALAAIYGRFRLSYGQYNGRANETAFEQRLRVQMGSIAQSDSGITFGGRIRLQFDAGGDAVSQRARVRQLSAPAFSEQTGGFRLGVTDFGAVEDVFDGSSQGALSGAITADSIFGGATCGFGTFSGLQGSVNLVDDFTYGTLGKPPISKDTDSALPRIT